MNIVFTGKFMKDGQHIVRELLVDICNERGWNVQPAVDYTTYYLVVAKMPRAETVKLRKARQLGVKVIGAHSFWDMAKNAA